MMRFRTILFLSTIFSVGCFNHETEIKKLGKEYNLLEEKSKKVFLDIEEIDKKLEENQKKYDEVEKQLQELRLKNRIPPN